jgi:hypothetical protein
MFIENLMNSILFKIMNWKNELFSVLILVLIIIYIKHKLTFWSRQNIPHEIILMNNWFSNSISETDQKNSRTYGKIFG